VTAVGSTVAHSHEDDPLLARMRKARQGVRFCQARAQDDWHYAGEARLGDANAKVCWWRPKGSTTYRVVYGNLEIRDADLDNPPPASEPAP
jgi:hypothetical protein